METFEIFSQKSTWYFSEEFSFHHRRKSKSQISNHPNMGKFAFNQIKYLHPGRTHLDVNQGLGCHCFLNAIQLYANQVFNSSQAADHIEFKMKF